jgi:hypothetical protein
MPPIDVKVGSAFIGNASNVIDKHNQDILFRTPARARKRSQIFERELSSCAFFALFDTCHYLTNPEIPP